MNSQLPLFKMVSTFSLYGIGSGGDAVHMIIETEATATNLSALEEMTLIEACDAVVSLALKELAGLDRREERIVLAYPDGKKAASGEVYWWDKKGAAFHKAKRKRLALPDDYAEAVKWYGDES